MYRLIAGLYMLGWFYQSLKHIDNKGTKIRKYDNNILEIWIMIFFFFRVLKFAFISETLKYI